MENHLENKIDKILTYVLFESDKEIKKSKRKIGKWTKWCYNLGYLNSKGGGRCHGTKRKIGTFKEMDYSKDYYYDIVNGEYKTPKELIR